MSGPVGPDVEATLTIDGPLSLRWTLALAGMWGASTWQAIDESGVWYARRTTDGPGTLHVRRAGQELLLGAYGPGAAALVESAPAFLGLEGVVIDSIDAHHEFVRQGRHRLSGYRSSRSTDLYPRLVAVALAQKVTGPNGKGALRRLAWTYGEPAPGPRDDLRLLPEPRRLARIPYFELHQLGIEKRRADLISRIARHHRALERALGLEPTAARQHLENLPGIGPWTSGVIMGGILGDPDAVPIGDYHLPNWVAWNLVGEPRADDRRMMELLAPYDGMRGMVARMVKGAGQPAPKRGPRQAVRNIRDH